jgi:hypothetical protein
MTSAARSQTAPAPHPCCSTSLLTDAGACSGETPWDQWYFKLDWNKCPVYEAPECDVVEYQCQKICKSEKVCGTTCDYSKDTICTPHQFCQGRCSSAWSALLLLSHFESSTCAVPTSCPDVQGGTKRHGGMPIPALCSHLLRARIQCPGCLFMGLL